MRPRNLGQTRQVTVKQYCEEIHVVIFYKDMYEINTHTQYSALTDLTVYADRSVLLQQIKFKFVADRHVPHTFAWQFITPGAPSTKHECACASDVNDDVSGLRTLRVGVVAGRTLFKRRSPREEPVFVSEPTVAVPTASRRTSVHTNY